MKKPANLKQRQDELSDLPPAPVAVTLELEAELYHALSAIAKRRHKGLEAYITHLLKDHTERTLGDEGE